MRVLYQDEFTKKFRDGSNLIDEHVSGTRITSRIDPEWSDEEVAKRYKFKLQPERSKREDGCFDLSLLQMDKSLKELMRCSEHDGNAVREVQ
jgi:hypothetical protein